MKGKLSELKQYPDLKASKVLRRPVILDNAPTGCCTFQGSPERFILLFYWQSQSYSVANIDFTHEGWEEIGGSRTIRITVDEYPKNHVPFKKWSRFWIDLNRNGHVVKREHYWGSDLVFRMHNVVLAQATRRQLAIVVPDPC